jgi:hypothetical protein
MKATFRLSPKVKYKGIVFAVFFLAALAGYSSLLFLAEPGRHGFRDKPSAMVVGGFGIVVFGSMLLMSLYMWASYYATQFSIDGTTLMLRTLLRNRQLDVGELKSLKWRPHPHGGSVVFRTLSSKASLRFDGFKAADRLKIIRMLRDLVSDQIQEGWPLFCHKIALPLRDNKPAIARSEPNAKFCAITRRRYDRSLLVALPLSIALAVGMGLIWNLWQFCVLPFLVVGAWALLRWNVPADGRRETRLTSTSQGWGMLVGWGGIVCSQLLTIALALLGYSKATSCWVGIIVLLTIFPPMFYLMHKSERKQKGTQATDLALIEWENSEAARCG